MVNKYYTLTLGCQMNKSDSERLSKVLEDLGYKKTEEEKNANLITVVACSVRQSAIDRIYGKIRNWQTLKEKKPLITILTGCVLPVDRKKMASFFDLIFEIKDLDKFPSLLGEKIGEIKHDLPVSSYFDIHPLYESRFQAYVPIMTGCNNFCAYCAVPYTRGREISRSPEEIIREVKNLLEKGYKEITLLGQNVNSYKSGKADFPALLKKIANLPGKFWLRFLTSHPKDLSDQLIKVIAKSDKICKYLHLPVQTGNNAVLKRMNRKYTREHYLNLIEKIRKEIPEVAISTDTIVGFAGESREQFEDTKKLYQEAKFDMAYIVQYSPRPGTIAQKKFKDDISRLEKERREKELNKILEKTALENNKKLVGKTLEVLVEKKLTRPLRLREANGGRATFNLKLSTYLGKTATFKTIKFTLKNENLLGKFLKVKILKAKSFGLEGKELIIKS